LITTDTDPVMNIHNSRNITLQGIRFAAAEVLLNVTGDKSGGIQLKGTDTSKAKKGVALGYGAKKEAVKTQ
jgi:hypothetical protein